MKARISFVDIVERDDYGLNIKQIILITKISLWICSSVVICNFLTLKYDYNDLSFTYVNVSSFRIHKKRISSFGDKN